MNTYFIRHTSVDVAPGVCYGRSDVPLSDTFEEEASRTLEQIKDIKFDKVGNKRLMAKFANLEII